MGEPANKGRGDPSTSKLNSNNRTFKTSLAKPICQLFTNEKLLKSDKFLHQLKFPKRSKNYTAVYKEYHQTEALIQGQLEQELKQAKLESQTWIKELEAQHNWQLTHDELLPEVRIWVKQVKQAIGTRMETICMSQLFSVFAHPFITCTTNLYTTRMCHRFV